MAYASGYHGYIPEAVSEIYDIAENLRRAIVKNEMLSGRTLTATVSPENAFNCDVRWSSSDDSVATVTVKGIVTAVGAGTAEIRAAAEGGGYAAACDKIRVSWRSPKLGLRHFPYGRMIFCPIRIESRFWMPFTSHILSSMS